MYFDLKTARAIVTIKSSLLADFVPGVENIETDRGVNAECHQETRHVELSLNSLPSSLTLIPETELVAYREAVKKARKARARAGAKPYQCLECGRRMSGTAANRALDHGCPGCGGCDIDIAREPAPPR